MCSAIIFPSKQAIALLNAVVQATDESNLLHSRATSLEIKSRIFTPPRLPTNFLAIFAFPISKVDEECQRRDCKDDASGA